MAGGRGTRFWPESRYKLPKQFLPFFGKRTLLEESVLRVKNIIPRNRQIIFTLQDKIPATQKILKIAKAQIVAEPIGRNTAPCAILAAMMVSLKDPQAVMAILPSDHHVQDPKIFSQAVKAAGEVAGETGFPVTFSIQPRYAHTGYGYLEKGELYKKHNGFFVYKLKRFHEKPDAHTAKRFLESGNFYWNSGTFIWSAKAILEAAKKHLPKAYELSETILFGKGSFQSKLKKYFPLMPNTSIDYGLMEKLGGNILTMPVDFGWSDVGGWQSLPELFGKTKEGNTVFGKAVLVESGNSIVKTNPKKLIALLGVQDLVVIDTPDALLIAHRSRTESIRQIVDVLEKQNLKQYL